MTVRAWLDAGLAIVWRDMLVFASYRWRLVTMQLGVVFSLALFYYLSRLVNVAEFAGPDAYFSFAVVGLIILQVVQSTFEAPGRIREELVAGTWERLVVSAFGPLAMVVSLLIFPLMLSLVTGAVSLVVAAVLFGLDVEWSTVPLALPVAVLGATAFSAFSLAFAALILRFKQAPGAAYVMTAITLVSGLYFPVSLLPDWLEWASKVQPFTPTVDLLRYLIVGLPLDGSPWSYVATIAGFTVVMVPIGIVLVTAAIRASRRTGTITEF
jgi:ABC-2 type transport system permease protein